MRMTTIPESHASLIDTNQILILGTNGGDGFPQITALWFLVEDGKIKVSLTTARQKTKNMVRDPNVTLFFVDPENPNRTLEIRAIATVMPDPDYEFADMVGAKYGGANLREMDAPGQSRVVVSFEPVKANTFG
jgi:PPOX class probable F420-dependent enzyme